MNGALSGERRGSSPSELRGLGEEGIGMGDGGVFLGGREVSSPEEEEPFERARFLSAFEELPSRRDEEQEESDSSDWSIVSTLSVVLF